MSTSIPAQILREVAERIRLRCRDPIDCDDCNGDAEALERVAAEMQAEYDARMKR